MELINAGAAHIELTYSWANDPEERKNSFHPGRISYETHREWFINKLNDKNCLFFIGKEGNENIGLIRLDVKNGTGEISYFIDKSHRGKGYGKKLIALLEAYLSVNSKLKEIVLVGKVKESNIPSVKCFLSQGFKPERKDDYMELSKKIIFEK